ncbi:MAG: DNA-binding protein [Clostridia bacterium]|nr:DNA-binding protein [Clostridia bacterium]
MGTESRPGRKREEYCRLLDHYGPALSGRCRDVLELYYEEDFSLGEIAENCGITRQGVLDAIRRGETDLDRLERNLHVAERIERILDLVSDLRANASEPEQVRRLADAIAEAAAGEEKGD